MKKAVILYWIAIFCITLAAATASLPGALVAFGVGALIFALIIVAVETL